MSKLMKVALLIIGGVIVLSVMGSGDKSNSNSSRPRLPPPAVGAEISEEYFNQVKAEASWDCKNEIERRARYDFQWTQTIFGHPLFGATRWNKYQRADGHLVIRGDEAKAQNGFGAWIRVNYYCEYDPATKRVIDASFSEGRL